MATSTKNPTPRDVITRLKQRNTKDQLAGAVLRVKNLLDVLDSEDKDDLQRNAVALRAVIDECLKR